MRKLVDRRIACPCCGMRTWSNDYIGFMRDHDRPDGRVCREAQRYIARNSEVRP